jgi:spoIIIJ-associated protein
MKDPVFSGRDVAAALEAAAESLGLPKETLRYVVLDAGRPGGLGVSPTAARIAVLLAGSGGPRLAEATRAEVPDEDLGGGDEEEEFDFDLRAHVRELVQAVADAAGIDLAGEEEETEDGVVVHLVGGGRAALLEDDAAGFRALDQIVQRSWRPEEGPRVILECEGYREARDEALGARARELAAEVRTDGQPRILEALNAYERRIVHMALADDPDVETYSVGRGADRRITVARRGTRPPTGD